MTLFLFWEGSIIITMKLTAAVEILEDLLKKDPEAFQALDLLGAIYMDRKEYEKAADYLKKAVAVNPDLETAYFKLGVISEIRDDLAGALENYEKALSINPHNSEARERIVQVYLKQKDSGKALEDIKGLEQSEPGKCRDTCQDRHDLFFGKTV